MKINFVTLPAILLALLLTLTACTVQTPAAAVQTAVPTQPTATSIPTPTLTPTLPSPTENPIHSLGQLVKLSGLTLEMIGVNFAPTQIQVTFAAKNMGTTIISANFIDFSANTASGTKLDLDYCVTPAAEGIPQEYAILQPGENLRGTICWKSADPKSPLAPQTGIQVSYTPEGSAKVVGTWDVSSAGKVDAAASLAVSDFATPPHAQGEAVTVKDITITFDGVTFQGGVKDKTWTVMAHFTLENKGSSSYKFGEFLSNSFSVKLADGSTVGTDSMTIGCQNTTYKVEVAPGQKLAMTICFDDPGFTTLAPGSFVNFFPDIDHGDRVVWVTK